MTPEGLQVLLEQLDAVGEDAHAAFAPPGPDHTQRLAQFDAGLANARASLEALGDEDMRVRHLHGRLAQEETLGAKHGHQLAWLDGDRERVVWDARREVWTGADGQPVKLAEVV